MPKSRNSLSRSIDNRGQPLRPGTFNEDLTGAGSIFFRECDVLGLRVVGDSYSDFCCNFFCQTGLMPIECGSCLKQPSAYAILTEMFFRIRAENFGPL
jgi:hypothetical protein